MEPVIPKDIPLPLPAPFWLLEVLLLVSFALHILFVNLMVGGSIMVLFTEALGLKSRDWDRVSLEIAKTITVNKSLAVVLGVAPLLSINVAYTVQFYSANALTGNTWLLIIPLVTAAFLLTYLHKYTWESLKDNNLLHLSFSVAATALFLFIPLIFLSNVNLMLYPEHWRGIKSFWDALTLPNVLPRYFHFLAATMALIGLFLVKYMGRETYYRSLGLTELSRARLVRSFYGVTFAATGSQFLFGPLLFLTLPSHVVSMTLLLILTFVIVPLAAVTVWWLWQEVRAENPGRRFWPIVGVLSVVVAFMVYARHDIRETAIVPHRALIAQKTADFMAKAQAAQSYVVIPGGLGGKPLSPGAMLFQRKCSSCHALDRRLTGPPLVETGALYAGNPEGIVAWALKPSPTPKRPGYGAMPAQEMPREDLLLVADYILEVTGNQ